MAPLEELLTSSFKLSELEGFYRAAMELLIQLKDTASFLITCGKGRVTHGTFLWLIFARSHNSVLLHL